MQQPPLPARFGQQLGVVSTLYRGLVERLLTPHDVTWAQFALLLHLARRGGPSRISEIASAIELTQPAVTKIVQKFASQNLVEIHRDQIDGRNRLVRITPDGIARLLAIQRMFGPVFDELLEGWEEIDLDRLIADLLRLTDRLNAMRQGHLAGNTAQ
jgi:MarR family transcriptional regulator, transcriptional regulator for hemolysin